MQLDESKTAVVTGGASGLGAATAQALSDRGVHVTIFDMNAEAGAARADALGGQFAQVNVADPESVAQGFAKVTEGRDGLDIVVNCAGIGDAQKTVGKDGVHDPAVFSKVIGVNLVGSFNVASQGAAIMAASEPAAPDGERGVIVNTASVAAFDGQIGQVAYAASKGGIVGMTLPMARDLSRMGIRVMTIAPGLFLTPLLESLPEEVQQSLGQQVPFPSRLGDPSEYAAMVCHIAENRMLNGEVIRLDGAIRMAPR